MTNGNKRIRTAVRTVEEYREILEGLAKEIWEHPESGFKEKIACEKTAKVLEDAGFSVETGAGGVPTAIRAAVSYTHLTLPTN